MNERDIRRLLDEELAWRVGQLFTVVIVLVLFYRYCS
jgi:hypothetical protein